MSDYKPMPPKEHRFTRDNAAYMGAKGGRNKKGSKHLSTIIRELADSIDWDKTTLKNKDELKAKYGGQGWLAIVHVAFTKAMTGDTKAMEWLAKNGYGNKIDITTDDKPLNISLVEFIDEDSQDQDTDTD